MSKAKEEDKPASAGKEVPAWFTGLRFSDGELCMTFQTVGDDVKQLTFTPKKVLARVKGSRIGRLYNLTQHDEQGKWGLPPAHGWHDHDGGKTADENDVITWQAKDRAARQASQYGKLDQYKELDAMISRLQRIRNRLSIGERAAFDSYLLQRVRL